MRLPSIRPESLYPAVAAALLLAGAGYALWSERPVAVLAGAVVLACIVLAAGRAVSGEER